MLGDADLHASLCAIEDDNEALPRHISVQRIVHDRLVLVFDHHIHGILDADIVAEHTLIPLVSVFMLGVQIHPFQVFIPVQMERERIVLGSLAAIGTLIKLGDSPLLGIFLAIEPQIAHGEDRIRLRSQPEVHQIKVMR
ncbi:hypothetical protein D3C75_974140 [compost metagenome]